MHIEYFKIRVNFSFSSLFFIIFLFVCLFFICLEKEYLGLKKPKICFQPELFLCDYLYSAVSMRSNCLTWDLRQQGPFQSYRLQLCCFFIFSKHKHRLDDEWIGSSSKILTKQHKGTACQHPASVRHGKKLFCDKLFLGLKLGSSP